MKSFKEEFKTVNVKVVIEIGTLGTDKVFSDQQKEYLVDWDFMVKKLRDSEVLALRNDIAHYALIKKLNKQSLDDRTNVG